MTSRRDNCTRNNGFGIKNVKTIIAIFSIGGLVRISKDLYSCQILSTLCTRGNDNHMETRSRHDLGI